MGAGQNTTKSITLLRHCSFLKNVKTFLRSTHFVKSHGRLYTSSTMLRDIEGRLQRLTDEFSGQEYMSQIEDYRYWGQWNKNNKYATQFILERDKYMRQDYDNKPLTEFFHFMPSYKEDEAIQVLPIIDEETGSYKRIYPESKMYPSREFTVLSAELYDLKIKEMFRLKYGLPPLETLLDTENKVEEGEEKTTTPEEEQINKIEAMEKKLEEITSEIARKFGHLPKDVSEEKLENFDRSFLARVLLSMHNAKSSLDLAISEVFSGKSYFQTITVEKKNGFKPTHHGWHESFPYDKYPKVETWMTEEECKRVVDKRKEMWNQDVLEWVEFADRDYLEKLHIKENRISKTFQGNIEYYIWLRDLKAIDQSAQAHVYPLGKLRKHPKALYPIRPKRRRGFIVRTIIKLISLAFRAATLPIRMVLKPFTKQAINERINVVNRLMISSIAGMPYMGFGYLDSLPNRTSKRKLRQIKYERTKLKQAQLPLLENLLYEELKNDPQVHFNRFVKRPLKKRYNKFVSHSGVSGVFIVPIVVTTVAYLTTKYIENKNTLLHQRQLLAMETYGARSLRDSAEQRKKIRDTAYENFFKR